MNMFDDYFAEFKVSRADLWAAMDAIGATRAEVEFSGGNDDGGTDAIRVYKGDTELPEDEVPPKLTDLLNRLPNEKYYTFAGDFDVSGRIEVDRATKTIKMTGSEQVWKEMEEEYL